jgi:hypothetical protein
MREEKAQDGGGLKGDIDLTIPDYSKGPSHRCIAYPFQIPCQYSGYSLSFQEPISVLTESQEIGGTAHKSMVESVNSSPPSRPLLKQPQLPSVGARGTEIAIIERWHFVEVS